jgi:competence protein ComEC
MKAQNPSAPIFIGAAPLDKGALKTLALSRERVGIGFEILKWLMVFLIIMLSYIFVDKQALIETSNRTLPPAEAALLNGIVWGDKSGFGKENYINLKNSGLVHLVVVSGSNLMLLGEGVIGGLAWLLGRKKTIILAMILATGYAGLVGWELPVTRALLMMGLMYLAQILGKKFNPWRALILTVIVMFLADNKILFELSFWLSIMAFVGVITNKNKNILMKVWWINLWTIPIIGLIIGKIAWITPITNMLVIGLIGPITILSVWGLWWLAYPLLWTVNFVSGLTGIWVFQFNWLMVIGWYMVLIYVAKKTNSN